MIISYWLFLSGTVFIAGALAITIFITIPCGAARCVPAGDGKSLGTSAKSFMLIVSFITLFSGIIHTILHCSVMTETSFLEVFSILPMFITKTKYGLFSLIRVIFLALITSVLFVALKRNDTWIMITGLLFTLSLLITLSMSGHQGTQGYTNIPFFLDIFHSIAISVWIGGIFFIRACYSFFLKNTGIEMWDIILALLNNFSRTATISVTIVVVTGLVLYVYNIGNILETAATQYGIVLLIKMAIVAIVLTVGGLNKFFIIPRLNKTDRHATTKLISLRKRLDTAITTEVFLGLVILLTTGILTHLSPEG